MLIIGLTDDFGVGFLYEFRFGTDGIAVENLAVLIEECFESPGIRGQIVHFIPFCFKTAQKIEKRGRHFHSFGDKGVLAGAFEVEDRNFFIAVIFASERGVVVHRSHKIVETVGNGLNVREAVVACKVCEESEGPDCTVYFGGDDALREKTAVHAHFIG